MIDLRLGEAGQRFKLAIQRQVSCHVEGRGEIIHRDRQNTSDKHIGNGMLLAPLFERFEKSFEETVIGR